MNEYIMVNIKQMHYWLRYFDFGHTLRMYVMNDKIHLV